MRHFLHSIALFFFLFTGLAHARSDCPVADRVSAAEWQALPAKAGDHGLLWKISKDGRSSWLYGTLHVGKPQWYFPGPQLRAAFAASDVLVMELDPTAAEVQNEMQDRSRWGLRFDELPPALQAEFRRQLQRACLPEALTTQVSPAMLQMTLSVLDARRIGLDAAYGSEMMWLQQARDSGKPLLALETAREQFAIFEGIPREQALQMLPEGLRQLDNGSARRQLERLSRAWASGNEQDLASYERWCNCVNTRAEKQFMQQLLDERNRRMAPKIDQWHQDGKSLFVAVGALHLVGKAGLVNLLRQRGYRVERIAPANP
ncbi:TraB/GumN family protein [Chitinilyticum piscinae]|uniref:TraB/GumN family protein n=1 Tax=Chitinilyticum piscinae TaxID=2866724 RepID=A0A8J7KDQ0_9NEIS|nr:TraB/GumN family protein [Chitinilyticum piscinae]MBE9608874.1 TraB/GumN family protein [Chitinilyticum piscinae]